MMTLALSEGEMGGDLCIWDFIHQPPGGLVTYHVTPMIPKSADTLVPSDRWSSLKIKVKRTQ